MNDRELYFKNCEDYNQAMKALIQQLELAENWELDQLYGVLENTGAWDTIKKELRHIGWIPLLEKVFHAAAELEK